MTQQADTALVLAAGRGTRMRRDDASVALDPAQERAAAQGLKAMIPDAAGRPFIDHVLTALADAGITSVGLIVPSDHATMAAHLRDHPTRRTTTTFLVQAEPTGTAHAILAAEQWIGTRNFIALNADNVYDPLLLRALASLDGPGCAAFDPAGLIEASNFPADRVASFALLRCTDGGDVAGIVEKPTAEQRASFAADAPVSMNVWRFDPEIFQACREVPISSRGEHELPEAVALAIAGGMRVRAVPTRSGVLDLSSRGDVAEVAALLASRPVST